MWLPFSARRKARKQREELEALRLQEAQRELSRLKNRSARAIDYLEARNDRNHWRESIERMVQGAPS